MNVKLIVCAVSFQDFKPVCSWSTRRTDDMQSQYRAMHYIYALYSASRGKKTRRIIITGTGGGEV